LIAARSFPLMMVRRVAIAACALAVLAAPSAGAKPPRCHLAGLNVAHSKTIKVVKRTNEDTETVKLLGCVRPNGRTRTLAEGVASFTTETSLSLDAVAGTWVAIRSSSSNQYGGSTSLRTADVRTGKSYAVATESYMLAGPYQGQAVPAIAVNSRGFTAAMVDDLASGGGTAVVVTRRRVLLFDARGNVRELDSGPPGELDPRSLILDTHTVLWSHGGLTRYARF
jgi:hypothetical protein